MVISVLSPRNFVYITKLFSRLRRGSKSVAGLFYFSVNEELHLWITGRWLGEHSWTLEFNNAVATTSKLNTLSMNILLTSSVLTILRH